MFSKPIFWQSVKANYVLWVVCTVVLAAMLCLPAYFHDPSALASLMEALEGTPMAEEAGEQFDLLSTLLGLLTQTVYGFSGILVAMVYAVITANTLVASEVDRGSMAYTLSTPTRRTKVVFTKAVFLVVSLLVMYAFIGAAGLLTVQFRHHAVWGKQYPADITAAAAILGLEEEEIAGHLHLILENGEAFQAGAEARGVDSAVYSAYLTQAMQRDGYTAASEVLAIDVEELHEVPSLIQNDPAALEAAADAMGMDTAALSAYIDQMTAQSEELKAQEKAMQTSMSEGLTAAAKYLGMEAADLLNDLGVLKEDSGALAAASEAAGLDEATFTLLVNQALGASEVSADLGVEFDPFAYLMLNLGALLLLFAISGISFLASCIFNLSKHSLALGAGLPFAFLILYFLSQVNTTLEPLRFFSLLTLFSTESILRGGGYAPQFAILCILGLVLYAFAIRIFNRKDLPL